MKKLLVVCVAVMFFIRPLYCFAEISCPDLSPLSDSGVITENEAEGKSEISVWDKLAEGIKNGLTLGIPMALKLLGLTAGVLVMAGAIRSVSDLTAGDEIKNASKLVSSLSLCIAIYPTCTQIFSLITGYIKTLSQLLTGLTAAMTTVYVMGGNVTVASTNAASMYLLGNIINTVASEAIMPFLACAVGVALAGSVPGCPDLSSVSAFIRGTVNTVMAFAFSVFSFAALLQNSIAAAGDTLAYRTARFASGTFIPIIGGMIGDASRTVAGSILTVKSTVGAAGVAAVIALLMPPILISFFCKTALWLSSALASVLGCSNESRFLSDVSGLMGVLFALCAGIAVVMLISLAMFIKMEITV